MHSIDPISLLKFNSGTNNYFEEVTAFRPFNPQFDFINDLVKFTFELYDNIRIFQSWGEYLQHNIGTW